MTAGTDCTRSTLPVKVANSRFAVAVHAATIRTNPVVVRRIIRALLRAGVVATKQGKGGRPAGPSPSPHPPVGSPHSQAPARRADHVIAYERRTGAHHAP